MIQIGLVKRAPKAPKQEKYDFPVITLLPVEGAGKSHKISFNKAALEQMKFTDDTQVVFGKIEGVPFLCEGKNLPVEYDKYKRALTKGNKSITSKDDYNALLDTFVDLQGKATLELKLDISFNEDAEKLVGIVSYMPSKEDVIEEMIQTIGMTGESKGTESFGEPEMGTFPQAESIEEEVVSERTY